VVVVGASLAGAFAAITLRQEGFEGDIVLVGAEPYPPYERPALSKQYLRGEIPFEKLLVRPASFYEENRIEAVSGVRASRIRPGERSVELQDGRRIRYDKLLVATGTRVRRPAIPGLDLPGVLALRSIDDADAIRREMRPGQRAVVIGMGFIGCEVAASLRLQGIEVVAVDPSPTPLFRVLGQQIGDVVASVHRDNGVEMLLKDGVAAFEGDSRVQRVVTTNGRRIECDFVVVGIGVQPDVDVVGESGIATDNGILVDEYCRTNVADIFAAGDVANHYHPLFGRRMRVEHWQNAMQQGAAAARNMLGQQQPYDTVHWFWSDQYNLNLQYAGAHTTTEHVVVRGSGQDRKFLAFYLDDQGRVEAVVALNRGKDLRRALPLVNARRPMDIDRLTDEAVDLRDLVAMASGPRSESGATTA
jgi:3-phenylpropionate/trans-cinnamate dioxygenase ferredoxin reductase subunit